MTLEEAHTMIEYQGVYEIIYRKYDTEHLWHISNIEMADGYNEKCILAYCHEKDKDLTFSISKIVSAKRYWIGILSKDSLAPKDGIYLLACGGLGQGIDIEYRLHVLKQNDPLIDDVRNWAKPIAYHYLSQYEDQTDEWETIDFVIDKQKYEEIPAPNGGIPVLAIIPKGDSAQNNASDSVEYCCYNYSMMGGRDITAMLKWWESYDSGWDERWDGAVIKGFQIILEYDFRACRRDIELRLKKEPDLFN